MSATSCSIRWGITVEDYEHWTKEHLEQCDKDDPGSYADWVVDRLVEVMHKAGQDFVTQNPDLFRGELV